MPPLMRSHHSNIITMTLPPRQAKVIAETDVLVVGGGPAGLGAAIGAAKAGAGVILAERYGFLGGNATAALVMLSQDLLNLGYCLLICGGYIVIDPSNTKHKLSLSPI